MDPAAVAQLRLALVRLARRIRQHAPADITASQLSALSTIRQQGPLRLHGVAAAERVTKSRVTRLVARLDELGLITRVIDPADGRCTVVAVTRAGEAVLAETRERTNAYLKKQVDALSDDERARLADALPVLIRLLEDAK